MLVTPLARLGFAAEPSVCTVRLPLATDERAPPRVNTLDAPEKTGAVRVPLQIEKDRPDLTPSSVFHRTGKGDGRAESVNRAEWFRGVTTY